MEIAMLNIEESVKQRMELAEEETTKLKTELSDLGCFETKGRIDEVSRICSDILENQDCITNMVCNFLEKMNKNHPKGSLDGFLREAMPLEQDPHEFEDLIFGNAKGVLINRKCIFELNTKNKKLRSEQKNTIEELNLLQKQVTLH